MGIKGHLRNIFNAAAAQLPVIGPHALIEGELLLSGKKPIGWVDVVSPQADPEAFRRERDVERRLNEAVAAGRLKAVDVIINRTNPNGTTWTMNNRHYCQPGYEADMKVLADVNRALWNGQPADDSKMTKDYGGYLGYRRRDQFYFNFIQRHARQVPPRVVDALYHFNEHVVQPAYQLKMLGGDRSKLPLSMEKSAEQGDSYEQWRMGMSYEHGTNGYKADLDQAMQWYILAADNGSANAQVAMGRAYETGHGVPQDGGMAATYYRMCADRDAVAQFRLAELIERGHGTPQEPEVTAPRALLLKSAEQGFTPAMASLAAHYAGGYLGWDKNPAEAAFWATAAAKLNYSSVANDRILSSLSPEQAADAQKRVTAWIDGHPAATTGRYAMPPRPKAAAPAGP